MTNEKEIETEVKEFTDVLAEMNTSLKWLVEEMNVLKDRFGMPTRKEVIEYIKNNTEE